MKVGIDEIKENTKNPRTIDYYKLSKIKASIKEFPEMLEIRPIVVNKEMTIMGGNLRWRAAKELGFKEVPIKIIDNPEKEYEFLIKDNLSYGEWNWSSLSEGYNAKELLDWGLDVPLFLREDDIDNNNQEKEKDKPNNLATKKDLSSAPKSDKKALYLFYSVEDKNQILKHLESERNGLSTEEYLMEKIRKILTDGNN